MFVFGFHEQPHPHHGTPRNRGRNRNMPHNIEKGPFQPFNAEVVYFIHPDPKKPNKGRFKRSQGHESKPPYSAHRR